MPTYEYECESCGNKLEALQKITADPLVECPSCHKNSLKRKPGGGIGLSFQGTGFYGTDYKSSSEPPKPSGGGGGCCPCGKGKGSCSSEKP